MRLQQLSGLVVSLFLTACGSDAKSALEASDTSVSGDISGSGSADTGSSDTEVADTEVADTTPRPSCGRVETTGSDRATYDIILPLLEQVASAEVTLDGSGLTVLPEGETVPYTGTFTAGTNCAQATVNNAPLALCFYDASGEDAQPLTLGAQLAAFLGRPGAVASATLIGAQRRDVDRFCTVSGHWGWCYRSRRRRAQWRPMWHRLRWPRSTIFRCSMAVARGRRCSGTIRRRWSGAPRMRRWRTARRAFVTALR